MITKNRPLFWPLLLTCLLLLLVLVSFTYGLLVGKNQIFPFQVIASAKQFISPSPFKSTTHRERRVKLFDTVTGQTDIVFIGDSHTEYGLWTSPFPTQSVANRGIQEDTTADVLKRIDSILATKPNQVFLMLGVNDILTGVAVEKIVENYSELVQTLTNNNINVVIQSTVQCHVSLCGSDKIKSVNALNEQLAQLTADEGLRFLPLGKLSESQGLATSLTFDGLHLTPEGYQIWISALNKFAAEQIPKR